MNEIFTQANVYPDVFGHIANNLSFKDSPLRREVCSATATAIDSKQSPDTPLVQEKKNRLAELLAEISKNEEKLNERTNKPLGLFCWCINFKNVFLNTLITKLFCSLFQCVSEEVDVQNKISEKINFWQTCLQSKPDRFKLIDAFGGIANYKSLPKLDLGNNVGRTGYIDFIKPDEMNAPIMRGVDALGRHFVTIRFEAIPDTERFTDRNNERIRDAVTFFQHNGNDDSSWRVGGNLLVRYYHQDNVFKYMHNKYGILKLDEMFESKIFRNLIKNKQSEKFRIA
jgi:hypothetical protein